ncbi:hypothetical protein [Polyangium aurulentum]|uniref:hypothetical protein n=1 Tax=Polyangium aurulentum TaxID=2567896 RepID=UPI0010AE5BBE|nr:hypothetical protein [Polyangium aurulentum]UQA61185.1 hypothetical protein E8A73_012180 [Polyangium aurulentum]
MTSRASWACLALAFTLSSAPALADEPAGDSEVGPRPTPQQPAPATPQPAPEAPPGTWVEGATPEGDDTPPPPPPPPPPANLGESEGATTFEIDDSSPPPSEVPTRMASPGMFGVGLGLTGLGFVTAVAGTGMYLAHGDEGCDECMVKRDTAAIVAVGGAIGMGLGLAMTFVGARQVPAPAWAKAMPSFVAVGPRGGVAGWRF